MSARPAVRARARPRARLRLALAGVWLALLLDPGAARAAGIVDVRLGSHPGYSRVVIELDEAAGYRLEHDREAGVLQVSVEASSRPEVLASRSGAVERVEVEPTPEGTRARIHLRERSARVREQLYSGPPRIVLDFRPVVAVANTPNGRERVPRAPSVPEAPLENPAPPAEPTDVQAEEPSAPAAGAVVPGASGGQEEPSLSRPKEVAEPGSQGTAAENPASAVEKEQETHLGDADLAPIEPAAGRDPAGASGAGTAPIVGVGIALVLALLLALRRRRARAPARPAPRAARGKVEASPKLPKPSPQPAPARKVGKPEPAAGPSKEPEPTRRPPAQPVAGSKTDAAPRTPPEAVRADRTGTDEAGRRRAATPDEPGRPPRPPTGRTTMTSMTREK